MRNKTLISLVLSIKKIITFYQNSSVIILLVLILLGTGMLNSVSKCFAQGPWTQKEANIPTGRWELSTCVVGGKIYAIGGASFSQPLPTVEEYDPVTDTWTTKKPMYTARQGLSTSVVNGKIYAIGGGAGSDANYTSVETFRAVEEYDPVTDTWTEKTDMPTARGFHSANVLDGKIYVIGGSSASPSGGTPILAVEVYDPATDTWTQKGNIPARIGAGFTSVVDGKIYVFGAYGSLRKVWEYDPVTEIWKEKAEMPTTRCAFSTSVLDEKIYVIGGHPGSSPYQALANVEIYDPATDNWTLAQDMLTGKCGVRTSVVNRRLYAIGGYTGTWLSAMCSTVEEYDPHLDLLPLIEKTELDRGYAKPGIDSVLITTKMKATTGITLLAEIEAPDQTPVDSLQLFDDGNHNDGNAGDSLYANVWPVLSAEEKHYYVDIRVTRTDSDTVNYPKDNVARFTTIGPITFENCTELSKNSITYPSPGYIVKYSFILNNMRSTATAPNVTAKVISTDSCASFDQMQETYVSTPIAYGDIAPGESIEGQKNIYYFNKCSDRIHFAMEIYSEGYHFWSDTFSVVTAIEETENLIPRVISLKQNYPNPFNPSTQIKFDLPKPETVKIEIYNIIGQKIQTLLNKPMSAGYHEVEFNGQNLSSGIYLYRIEAGEWSDVKKMILIR